MPTSLLTARFSCLSLNVAVNFGCYCVQIGFPDIGKAKGAVQSIFPIIDRKSQIDSSSPAGCREGPSGGGTVEGTIELKDVHFAYPARPSVIVFK